MTQYACDGLPEESKQAVQPCLEDRVIVLRLPFKADSAFDFERALQVLALLDPGRVIREGNDTPLPMTAQPVIYL